MHWVCLLAYCATYFMLGINMIMNPTYHEVAAMVLYSALAVLAYLLHRRQT